MTTTIPSPFSAEGWTDNYTSKVLSLAGSIYSFRFVVVDSSRSMGKHDAMRPVFDSRRGTRYEECTRYEEACATVSTIARISSISGTPAEFRFLHHNRPPSQPQLSFTVGKTKNDTASLGACMEALVVQPSGPRNICRMVEQVVEQVRWIEDILRITNKKALLIIVTDGEPADGNIIDALKPLQELPVDVIVRLCTEEKSVVSYWRNLRRAVDVDITVLSGMLSEATRIGAANKWLTYGQHLQAVRELGIFTEPLLSRTLTRSECSQMCQLLLLAPETSSIPSSLPDADRDWRGFLGALRALNSGPSPTLPVMPTAFCPLRHVSSPWIDIDALHTSFTPDIVRPVLKEHEDMLWGLFAFYATNAASIKVTIDCHSQCRSSNLSKTIQPYLLTLPSNPIT